MSNAAEEVPRYGPENGAEGGLGGRPGQRNFDAMTYHFRPVEGKGLKPIILPPGESVVIGRSRRLGIGDDVGIKPRHLECRMRFVPAVAVELNAIDQVFVKDRFGVLKMLKAGFVGYLKPGEVLYLTRRSGVPICGYVLTQGVPGSRDANHQDSATPDNPVEAEDECIDLLDDSSDEETETKNDSDSAKKANGTGDAEKRAAQEHGNGGRGSEGEGTPRQPEGGKGTADDPCLLSSDDDEVVVERETRGKKAKGKSRQKSADKKPQARKKPEKPKTYEDAGPTTHGAADRGFKANFTPEPAAEIPPRPDPAQPEDSPAVKASRETLLREWNEVVATQQLYRELVRGLNKKQAEYTEVIHQGPDASSGNLSRGMMQQTHNQRINEATVAIQQVMTKVNAARAASGVSLAKHQRARADLDRALAAMAREQQAAAQFRQGEASANDFQEEVKAWETIEQMPDLNVFSAGELRRIAKAIGVEITGLLEKDEFVKVITEKREGGREAWAVRKRKRAAEEAIAARQRQKLAELRKDEFRREADESAQAKAKHHAIKQVNAWARNADLNLFLQRCGIQVERYARTKKALTTAYRKAMMKFHPDRTRTASLQDQALAAEVTKWITHAWQNLRD